MKESSMIFTMYPILRGLADVCYSMRDKEIPYRFGQFYKGTWSCNRRKEN